MTKEISYHESVLLTNGTEWVLPETIYDVTIYMVGGGGGRLYIIGGSSPTYIPGTIGTNTSLHIIEMRGGGSARRFEAAVTGGDEGNYDKSTSRYIDGRDGGLSVPLIGEYAIPAEYEASNVLLNKGYGVGGGTVNKGKGGNGGGIMIKISEINGSYNGHHSKFTYSIGNGGSSNGDPSGKAGAILIEYVIKRTEPSFYAIRR